MLLAASRYLPNRRLQLHFVLCRSIPTTMSATMRAGPAPYDGLVEMQAWQLSMSVVSVTPHVVCPICAEITSTVRIDTHKQRIVAHRGK